MTPLEAYAELVEQVFGKGAVSFNKTGDSSNNVVGAIHNLDQFERFKANFRARLERLNSVYSTNPAKLKKVIVTVNDIARTSNWEGAIAELAALDYLHRGASLSSPVETDVDLPASRTYAEELGKKEANIDAYVSDVNTFFEMKVFKDTVEDMLKNVYAQLRKHFDTNDFDILAQYDHSMHAEDINHQSLLTEMKSGIAKGQSKSYKSQTVKNLDFRILWGAGVNIAEQTSDPLSRAEKYHQMVFKNADQFVKDAPTVLIYVVFPWYNLKVNEFGGANEIFYKAFCERVFCQYRGSSANFRSVIPKFNGGDTIHDVACTISGIVFLEDDTVLSDNPSITNIKSYVYVNPNAKNGLMQTAALDYISSLHNCVVEEIRCPAFAPFE